MDVLERDIQGKATALLVVTHTQAGRILTKR